MEDRRIALVTDSAVAGNGLRTLLTTANRNRVDHIDLRNLDSSVLTGFHLIVVSLHRQLQARISSLAQILEQASAPIGIIVVRPANSDLGIEWALQQSKIVAIFDLNAVDGSLSKHLELVSNTTVICCLENRSFEDGHTGINSVVDGKRALTARESDVYHLMSQGYSNHEIATELSIRNGTVKSHVANIVRKLGARNRVEAVTKGFDARYSS